jgi:hypothetical protein
LTKKAVFIGIVINIAFLEFLGKVIALVVFKFTVVTSCLPREYFVASLGRPGGGTLKKYLSKQINQGVKHSLELLRLPEIFGIIYLDQKRSVK